MERPLHFLHLEDDPNDLELVRATLESEGLMCDVEAASSREEFNAALERGGFDLILSDFTLPDFDGLSALRMSRAKAPEIPFILVSGTMGEEAAIESLQSGATDYVLKHRLSRLVPAVRRTLRESEERGKRRQAEEALQREQQFLKAVLESLEAGVVACDSRGVLTVFNPAAREFHGMSATPIPSEEWARHFDLYHPDGKTPMEKHAVPLFRALQGEHVRGAELMIVPKSGPARTLLVSGQPIFDAGGTKLGAVVALHDITERKQLEGQLQQAQKMEAIGQLAGGIAHDFNNILGAIIGYTELAKQDADGNEAVLQSLEAVGTASQRATGLVRQILAFSRQEDQERKPIQLVQVISEALKLLRATLPSAIEVRTTLDETASLVLADATQIHQIVMNLATNASHAMKDSPGVLDVKLTGIDVDANFARTQMDLRPGRYVRLSVSDTGHGMDRTTLDRIFEPFFTTKPPGKGSGMGLSTVLGITKSHHGAIIVYSQPGEGTAFHLYFPALDDVTEEVELHSGAVPRGHGERILFVDDEEPLAQWGQNALERLGYDVTSRTDVLEAIAMMGEQPGRFDLVVTDMSMPVMNGVTLSQRLLQIRADLPIILTTGYVASMTEASVREFGIRGLLVKPNTIQSLAEAVHRVLTQTKVP